MSSILSVTIEAIQNWVNKYLLNGLRGQASKKSPGRPSKLAKSQRRDLAKLVEEGPEKAGYVGNCWRSPMIQQLILEQFGVVYSIHYISQLLKNKGFSYQKAKLVSNHLNKDKVHESMSLFENAPSEVLSLFGLYKDMTTTT